MINNKWFVVLASVATLSGALLISLPMAQAGGAFVTATPAAPKEIPTDRIIVKLRDTQIARTASLAPAHVAGLSASAGMALTHVRAMSGDAQVLKLPRRMPLAEVATIARQLSADPQVEYAEPDRIMRPLLFPNEAQYTDQWHYHSSVAQVPYAAVAGGANLPGAWEITTGSAGIVVAVIDTGLVPHADIDGDILDGAGRVVPGYDFVSEDAPGVFFVANDGDGRDSDPTDPGDWATAPEVADPNTPCTVVSNSSWHGTHVAGTIGALGNNSTGVAGINWVSKILPVRVIGKCGGYLSDVLDGIRWAAGLSVAGVPANNNPANVLNLSLGGAGICGAAEQAAINDVVAAGAVMVVAAGNSSVDLAVSSESPANCNNVISVAAVNRNGGRAIFSGTAGSNFGTTVEIAAPGGETATVINGIRSTLNTGITTSVASPGGDTYAYYQGTSMAAPHVTGIVSLMLSVNPALIPSQALYILQSSARAFPTGTGSDCTATTCGAGIVDATAAVNIVDTALGILVPSPTSVSFGRIQLSQTAPTQTVTFTNADNNPLTLSANAISLAGADAAEFSVTGGTCVDNLVLAQQGDSCTVTLNFTPAVLGVRSANLLIASSAVNSSVSVPLSGGVPTVTVSATDAAAAEAGSDPGTFTITRSGPTTSSLLVNYALGGSATYGTDYLPVNSSVSIAAGSSTATARITPVDDSVYEGAETAVLTLSASASYDVGSPSSATVTIADNDAPPPAKSGGGGCFIATAAYGTPMAQDVRYLRAFRDEYLQTHEAGRWFVKQYYKYSPSLADYLRQDDDLRAVVRSALSPLIGLSRAMVSDSALAAQTADRP